ncbi:MAG: cation diffusion facilitator family transporter [Bacteroidota bacterium]|nr:cation diffusion facilitator family transporter [Bacteroidota bacterium]
MNAKVRTARLSVFSNLTLIILKTIVGIISGSVSILSEAIHSFMDLIAAVIAYFSVKISDTPPDERHPYGHGKIENVSGVVEAILIFVAACWIIFEASQKIITHQTVESLGLGSIVMLTSAAINAWVSHKLYKTAKETGSIALEADALHLKTDVYTSMGVGIGLLLIKITGLFFLDPFIAIIVALFILREAYYLLKKAFSPLLDEALTEEEIQSIRELLDSQKIIYHDLKTRRAGNYVFVDFHLEMDGAFPLKQVHSRCDEIENLLCQNISHLTVNIHVEPK